MARAIALAGHVELPLTDWEVASVAAGAADDPEKLAALAPTWTAAHVPGTAASALRAAKKWDLDTSRNFDADDWWFRCRFTATAPEAGTTKALALGGLATVADVWLNGAHVLRSDNMFVSHELDVGASLKGDNELVIRCRSLDAVLKERRPRPRWRTRLVEQQQLRWVRTTLLGRIPGWSPPVAAVGPWRPVALLERTSFAVAAIDLHTKLDGADGVASLSMRVRPLGAAKITGATLVVGDVRAELAAETAQDGTVTLRGEARVAEATPWWPHTHGDPYLYPAHIAVVCDGAEVDVDAGHVGFRTVELSTGDAGDGFELRVNGARIFCRGACWTTADIVDPNASPAAFRAALETARDCGMNMIRVGGTMLYEADAFYDLCDELGILVWQDFMFANMDYPIGDDAFATNVRREAEQTLDRLQAHPCVAMLCGNSEIEQQVAMLGMPRALWKSPLFEEVLPSICARVRPDVPYWSSSPSGGTLPFQVNVGLSHYYGVGAYERPLEDARRAGVRFTSECLAFANVPEQRTIDRVLPGGEAPFHHPRWKARTPRDSGAGWDFEDVRDHYAELLFGVDTRALRYGDIERYVALGRVTTGEVIARTFAEWRRRRSTCAGALVWFYRDLWPGAGWGLVDATGWPKAAYWHAKRVLAPVCVLAIDEGLNGLQAHVVNDTPFDVEGTLDVALYRRGQQRVANASREVWVPSRSVTEVHVDGMLDGFVDTTYAYRFGPPNHDVVALALRDKASGALVSDAFHFPLGLPSSQSDDVGLEATAEPLDDGSYALTLRAKRFAQSVAIDAGDFLPEDNYVHIAPDSEKTVRLRAAPGKKLSGEAKPLNATAPTKIVVRG